MRVLDAFDDYAQPGFSENARPYLAHEDVFARKYRHWRGGSGRSYAFSVYAPQDCPAYPDAVLIVAARRGGVRVQLACVDLGAFPEASLARLRRRYADSRDEIEFHIHLLAEREGDRRALIADVEA